MTKTSHIQVRLSAEDKALIAQYASEAGQNLSDYVRGAAMARVWHETTSPPDPPPAPIPVSKQGTPYIHPQRPQSGKRSFKPDPRK